MLPTRLAHLTLQKGLIHLQNLIRRAARRRRRAMLSLYNENRQMVYYLCRHLLGDESPAEEETGKIFEELWLQLPDGKLSSPQEVRVHLMQSTVSHCARRLTAQDPDIFRAAAEAMDPEKLSLTDSAETAAAWAEALLDSLAPVFRFCFLLQAVGDLPVNQTASLLQLNPRTLQPLWHAAKNQIIRQLSISEIKDSYGSFTYSMLLHELQQCMDRVAVPASVNAQAEQTIADLSRPKRPPNKVLIPLAVILAAAVIAVCAIGLFRKANQEHLLASIEVEGYGTITVALDAEAAPKTVENFVELANSGFYDGLTFHRIIEGFMMQGGDPNGDGTGGSEQTIVGEFSDNGHKNNLSHTRGAISMARSNDYNSASSQFFIVQEDSTYLDGQYAAFGYVTDGMDIVDQICEDAKPTDSNGSIEPENQPVIVSITILEQDEE